MSHSLALVIGANVEQQLAPYHEFECTGTNDQYVQDIDITADARSEYERRHDGESADTRRNFATFVQDWYGIQTVPHDQAPDIEGDHKYGYAQLNEAGDVTKVIDRTNPNKKWDWWVVGGRWTGFFKLKPGATSGTVGKPGLLTKAAEPGRADSAVKGDIDIQGMRDEAAAEALALWDRASALHGGLSWESWESMRERMSAAGHSIDDIRAAYHGQAAIVAMKADKEFDNDHFWRGFDGYLTPRDQHEQQARDGALSTLAVVHKGEWTERGEMGWFGVVHNETDKGQWAKLFNDLIDGLPDDTLLTVVDCHI